jgi:predicted O-methyltransferase YrrM
MNNSEQLFWAYDDYVARLFAVEDDVLQATRTLMQEEGLRPINVSATGGQLLYLLALMAGARRILEIGTLGGYSAIWLARALPADGRMITLELEEHHAAVARRNLAAAGLDAKVEVRVGPAAESLAALQAAGEARFDLVFIDADKDGYSVYLDYAVALVREGGLVLADNTLRPEMLDPDADGGAKRYNAAVAAHPALVSTIVPVLRSEGLDGLTISIKRSPNERG